MNARLVLVLSPLSSSHIIQQTTKVVFVLICNCILLVISLSVLWFLSPAPPSPTWPPDSHPPSLLLACKLDMPHSYVGDWFVCLTRLVCVCHCDMTPSCVWHSQFRYITHPRTHIYTRDQTDCSRPQGREGRSHNGAASWSCAHSCFEKKKLPRAASPPP